MRHCIFLVDVGRTGEGLSACEQAVALRPLSPPPTHHLARAWFAAGEIERAIQLVDRNVERYPAQPTARLIQLETRLYSDRWREADRLLSDDPIIALLGPVAVAVLKTTLHALNSGTGADADHAIAQATAAVQAGLLDPRERVLIAARLGRTEQALSWLTQMPAGSLVGKFILFHPGISALRRDPRFMQIAAREGLITYWRETNKWPDFCSDPTLPYDCRSTANALVPGVDAPNEESGSGSNKAT